MGVPASLKSLLELVACVALSITVTASLVSRVDAFQLPRTTTIRRKMTTTTLSVLSPQPSLLQSRTSGRSLISSAIPSQSSSYSSTGTGTNAPRRRVAGVTLSSSSSPARLYAEASAVDSDGNSDNNSGTNKKRSTIQSVRDKLRKLTGFSFTVFRKTLRGITGISLTAIYASTVAATGLWIRKITSVILSLFPSGFRYFLQPFLVAYYVPLFILRSLTGPTRKRARAKHEQVVEAWKDAVEYAENAEKGGYWPVVVSPEDGYFELQAPPAVPPVSVLDGDKVKVAEDVIGSLKSRQKERAELADAVAESVDRAMDIVQEEAAKGTS